MRRNSDFNNRSDKVNWRKRYKSAVESNGVRHMATAAAPSAFETLQQRVTRLLETWRAETAHISSSTERNSHPAYQEIISLGMAALPFLLRDLEKTRDGHLSKALSAITGIHPVPPESRGRIAEIADAWLSHPMSSAQ